MIPTRTRGAAGAAGSPDPALALSSDAALGSAVSDAVRMLDQATTVVVCGHVNPDGDALGSAFALALALRQRGAEVWVSWGGVDADTPPAPLDPALSFLVRDLPATSPDALPDRPDVLVCCDTAAPGRLGTLEPNLRQARGVLVIDHHAVGAPFGDVRLVDPGASSTGALVRRLIGALDVPLTPSMADALYLAILTDTGRFSHASTTPDDHRMAADLVEAGAAHTAIARAVYASASPGFIGLVSRVTQRATVDPVLTWSWSTIEDLAQTGAAEGENDGLIDLLRGVRDVAVSLFMRETPTGRWRCSLRSGGTVDVATIASRFGGGGHRLAAGFRHDGSPPQIAAEIRTHVDRALTAQPPGGSR